MLEYEVFFPKAAWDDDRRDKGFFQTMERVVFDKSKDHVCNC